jgi:hypothetical protein
VFKSTTGGAGWSPIIAGLTDLSIGSLLIDPTSPQTVYAGTATGVFKSTNGGGGWNAASAGLAEAFVQSLVIDPTDRRTL